MDLAVIGRNLLILTSIFYLQRNSFGNAVTDRSPLKLTIASEGQQDTVFE